MREIFIKYQVNVQVVKKNELRSSRPRGAQTVIKSVILDSHHGSSSCCFNSNKGYEVDRH